MEPAAQPAFDPGEAVAPASARPGLVVFAVSGCSLDAACLAGRLAQLAGTSSTVSYWAGDDDAPVTDAAGTMPCRALPSPACGALRVVVASRRARVFATVHRQLAAARSIRSLMPVADAELLRERLAGDPPQFLLVDDAMLDALDERTFALIRERAASMRVLLLCRTVHGGLAARVIAHGFQGCLETDAAPDTWMKAFAAVSRGELWLPRAALQQVASAAPPPATPNAARSPTDDMPGLTPREAEVVPLLREGLSNKEIGRRLGVREDTVKKHLQSVFRKLGVRRRSLLMIGKTRAVCDGA